MKLEGRYSEQQVYVMIHGVELLLERDRSLMTLVDKAGKKEIKLLCKRYSLLIKKLKSEI